VAGRIMEIERKSSDLIGNRTRNLPSCSIAPQTTKKNYVCFRDMVLIAVLMAIDSRIVRGDMLLDADRSLSFHMK
jgi:hypothetical protein